MNNKLSIDKVEERINHWQRLVDKAKQSKFTTTNQTKAMKIKQTNDTNEKLLVYWIGYKEKHYTNN